jgi:hypothetical protein
MKKAIQLTLFATQSYNVEPDIKEAMHAAARESGKSRAEIVDEMNRIALRYGVRMAKGNGSNVSEDTLEKWLNVNATGYFPSVRALMIFCAVMRDHALKILNILVRPLGLKVIGAKDIKKLEWAKEYHRVKEGRKKLRLLESEIEE